MNVLGAIVAVWGMLVMPVVFLTWWSDRHNRRHK